MRKLEKFLFFYSIIAITVFFITSAFFSPTPQNLISAILMFPLVFYFWIRLTNPDEVNVTKWSFRLLTIIIIISSLGIFGYWLGENKPKPIVKKEETKTDETTKKIDELTDKINELKNGESDSEQISEELTKIKEELTRLRLSEQAKNMDVPYESLSEIISSTGSSEKESNKITGKEGITSINAYAEPAFSSRILEKLPPNKEYIYYDTQNGWYKIILSSNKAAWVSSKDVEEIQ